MTQNQALLLQLLPILAVAVACPIYLYRAAKAQGSETGDTDQKSELTRLREELAEVKEERDALKRALKSLGQE